MTYQINEFRKALKAIGYKASVKAYSEFFGASVIHVATGETITGRTFWPDDLEAFKTQHGAALEVIERFKGKTFNGGFRVVIG